MRKIILLTAVAAISLGATKPVRLPAPQAMTANDRAQGAKAHPELLKEFGGLYQGPQAAYVTRIGQKIAVQSGLSNTQGDFTISLLNSSVNNAFAIPGGYVYVTRQLLGLMNNEAELASVLGHEVGHVAARHAQKRNERATIGGLGAVLATVLGAAVAGEEGARLGQQLGGTIAQQAVLSYSRSQEYQADDLGVSYLARAGYDPVASSTMLASLAAQSALDASLQGRGQRNLPEWASTHPDPASRVTRARDRAARVPATGKLTNRDSYLAAIDGMLFDDDPRQGVIDGGSFRHPELRLAFSAPDGFAMSNSTQAVTISGSGAQAQFTAGPYRGNLESYVDLVFRALAGQNSISYGEVERTQINGLNAAYATARANTQSGPVAVTVFAYEFSPQTAFHFVGITPAGSAGALRSLYASMRRLSPSEAAAIKPRRIQVVTVKPGDSVASLAQKMAYADNREIRFRTLNALSAGDTLQPGQRVKLIVAG